MQTCEAVAAARVDFLSGVSIESLVGRMLFALPVLVAKTHDCVTQAKQIIYVKLAKDNITLACTWKAHKIIFLTYIFSKILFVLVLKKKIIAL